MGNKTAVLLKKLKEKHDTSMKSIAIYTLQAQDQVSHMASVKYTKLRLMMSYLFALFCELLRSLLISPQHFLPI